VKADAKLKLAPQEHEHEGAYQALFREAGLPEGPIKAARAAGLSWAHLLALLSDYGPQFLGVLKVVLTALNTPAPEGK
jgi:hypothetical protein